MSSQTAYGSIFIGSDSKFQSPEVNRWAGMQRGDRARQLAYLLAGVPYVFTGLAVSVTGTGLEVQVATGEGCDGAGLPIYVPASVPSTAVAYGQPAEGTAPQVTLAAADPTNPRIDLVYLRAATLGTDYAMIATSDGTNVTNTLYPQTTMSYFTLGVVQGTPAASPVAPAQLLATDLVLAQVTVPTGATTLASGNVADVRKTLGGLPVLNQANTWAAKQNFAASTAAAASVNLAPGSTPTAPIDGDAWLTINGFFARVNGVSQQLAAVNVANTFTQPQTFSQSVSVTGGSSPTSGTSIAMFFDGTKGRVQCASWGTGWEPVEYDATSHAFYCDGTQYFYITSSSIGVNGNKFSLAASTTAYASFNVPQGTSPTSPVNGDLWGNASADLFWQANGGTWTFAWQNRANIWSQVQTFNQGANIYAATAGGGATFSIGNSSTLDANGTLSSWLLDRRTDNYFGAGTRGLSFWGNLGNGYVAPMLFTATGDVILAGALNATNGNVYVGGSGAARLHAMTANDTTTGQPTAFNNQHFVVGLGAASGTGSGGVFISYDQTNTVGYIGALAPGSQWLPLKFRASSFVFQQDSYAWLTLNAATATFGVQAVTPAPTTAGAGLKLTPGVAPTTPSDGEIWPTTTGLYAQIGGITKKLDGFLSRFRAYQGTAQTGLINGSTKITFDTVVFDKLSEYSTANNRFTATDAGNYLVSASVLLGNVGSAGTQLALDFFVNGSIHTRVYYDWTGVSTISPVIHGSAPIELSAGDYVEVYMYNNAGGLSTQASSAASYFAATRIA